MSNEVRVGLIGPGAAADFVYLQNIQNHPRATVTAICGRTTQRTKEIAAKYRVDQSYTDPEKMLQEAGLDAVLISTGDELHYPMAMLALDAGVHVACEKPLALNAEQAEQMYSQPVLSW